MSDSFEMLVDAEVSLADAPAVCVQVIDAFRDRQLITGDQTEDCVLGGTGYRLGPAIPTIYTPEPNESRFWELKTSGVEPSIERSFNHWALGPSCEYVVCPNCDLKFDQSDSPIWERIFEAVGLWHELNGDSFVRCPSCGNRAKLVDWHSRPP